MSEVPICPNCKEPLRELSEEFRSLNVYQFLNGKYEHKESPIEVWGVRCKKCGYVLPYNIIKTLENLLPSPGK